MAYGLPSLQSVANMSAFIGLHSIQDKEKEEEKSKHAKAFINADSASSHKEATSKPDSKVQRELSPPKAEVPNNATHPCMPTNNQPESFQQDVMCGGICPAVSPLTPMIMKWMTQLHQLTLQHQII